MKHTFAVSVLALLTGFADPASAQGPGPLRWPQPASAVLPLPATLALGSAPAAPLVLSGYPGADSTRIPPTHWRTGAFIGGAALGLLTAVAFVGVCGFDSPCHRPVLFALGGFALGGGVGFAVGALIGGQFPARTP